jgi:ADP-ribosylglycohydrolase
MMLAREHFTGCLLGGAVCDALGAPVEFLGLRQRVEPARVDFSG